LKAIIRQPIALGQSTTSIDYGLDFGFAADESFALHTKSTGQN